MAQITQKQHIKTTASYYPARQPQKRQKTHLNGRFKPARFEADCSYKIICLLILLLGLLLLDFLVRLAFAAKALPLYFFANKLPGLGATVKYFCFLAKVAVEFRP
jgi:hypothetical protein